MLSFLWEYSYKQGKHCCSSDSCADHGVLHSSLCCCCSCANPEAMPSEILENLKIFLALGTPVKGSILTCKTMQWMGYFGELRDKPPVVRSQSHELVLLLQEGGNRKFLHGSDMQRGWLQTVSLVTKNPKYSTSPLAK